MEQDELKRIPCYRVTGDKPDVSKKIKKICYGSSVYSAEQNGARLAGQIAWVSAFAREHGAEVHILPNDTGNRFMYQVDNEHVTPREASEETQRNGSNWIVKREHAAIWAHFGIHETRDAPLLEEKRFPRWEDFRNNRQDHRIDAEFQRALDGFYLLADIDPAFRASVESTVAEFMQRGNRPNLAESQFRRGQALCREFLYEENAVFTMCGRRYDAFAYPGPLLECQQFIAKDKFKIPDDLRVEQLPESIQAVMEPGQTAKEALCNAITGLQHMQWIQLRRNNKYYPDLDLSYALGGTRFITTGEFSSRTVKLSLDAEVEPLSQLPAAEMDLLRRLEDVAASRPVDIVAKPISLLHRQP